MTDIDSILREDRVFPPPAEFQKTARVPSIEAYQEMWDRADRDPETFWAEIAESNVLGVKQYKAA